MIQLKQVTLRRGTKIILENSSVTLNPRQKIGIIGKNGAGKSSLFAALQQDILPDQGDISIPSHWTIAHVAQETPALDCAAIDYVLAGDTRLSALEAELKLAQNQNNIEKIAALHEELEHIDAWRARARAAQLLAGLGFKAHEHSIPVKHFSGGWRMRLNLAQALQSRAELLLLDEPTNHLDIEAVLWLQDWLAEFEGTLLVISHDRDFLDQLSTQILEIAHQTCTLYSGNYSDYERAKAAKIAREHAQFAAQQKQREQLEQFIRRFKAKASKAKQAQSRIKALERLEHIAQIHVDSPFSFEFFPPEKNPSTLISFENIAIGYGSNLLFSNVNLSIEAGAKIGVLGQNGVGKSSFIKVIAGELAPISGKVHRAKELTIAYFAQHQLEILHEDQSPLWHLERLAPNAKPQELRNYLGGFNFHDDSVLNPIRPFSGGEKARLVLALLIWQKPNLLLLDEPTNHLDLEMRHALTLALQQYSGAVLLISHDRALLESSTDVFWWAHNQTISEFDGDLNQYREVCRTALREEKKPNISTAEHSRKQQKRLEAQQRQARAQRTKPIEAKIKQLEVQLYEYGKEKEAIDLFLNQESAYLPEHTSTLQTQLKRQAQLNKLIEELESEWLQLQEELEMIASEYLNGG